MTIKAGIFDLDGVITDTAEIHFLAWKRMFDAFLTTDALQHQHIFHAFTYDDYKQYVDGKSRLDGIHSFLQTRHIRLQNGPQTQELAQKKQDIFLELLHQGEIPVFSSTITFIHQLHANNIRTAVASSSSNCQMILKKTGIEDLFSARVDGNTAKALKLPSKPQPDLFLEAAKRIHISPAQAFIVEDAIVGVQAGRAGQFALVIGIARTKQMKQLLKDNGAHLVVHDLSEVNVSMLLEESWNDD